jgi:hypothetical protein
VHRPAALALAAGLAAAGCSAPEPTPCPGDAVASFRFKGPLVLARDLAGDPDLAGLDPVPGLPDCTPDPLDLEAPILYPHLLAPFEATLAADPDTDVAALCKANGWVLTGTRLPPLSFSVEATAEGGVLCDSACAAALRLVVTGDLVPDPGGGPATFRGVLVEVLTRLAGSCDACLPAVPGTDPAERACAARYALSGTAP